MTTKKANVTLVEISMAIVVLAIVSVVALPALNFGGEIENRKRSSMNDNLALQKVKSAYDLARATEGRHPKLGQVVEYLDADFASENKDQSGIVFWGYKKRVIVETYNDAKCKKLTSGEKPGESDIVRCIKGFDA